MALNNLFKINLPYGLYVLQDGRIAFFNREYQPLGYGERYLSGKEQREIFNRIAIDVPKLTIDRIRKILDESELKTSFKLHDDADYKYQAHFYFDGDNPVNTEKASHYKEYFKILKEITKYQVKK
ncbi:hypothetical protein [Nonlabens agnitus]|uniref:Uncharacterized protein n=1 Tax=Nonlabens agnitus TaxID=870484 RepID=A0A2S9WXB7_9FLAO|nr:hypothetical protein [Nonlabens agnitus]PRP68114.1 hypothetical protein BST86_13965 [Nonlabens agnitus]